MLGAVARIGPLALRADCPFSDPRMPTLPFKLNQDRRHHIPKQKHKVANWAERYRNIWEQRFDRLDKYLQQIKTKEEKRHGHKRRGKE